MRLPYRIVHTSLALMLAGVQLACNRATPGDDARVEPQPTGVVAQATTVPESDQSGHGAVNPRASVHDPETAEADTAEADADAACSPLSADERERWHVAPGVEACKIARDLSALSVSGHCTKSGWMRGGASCPVDLRDYHGKIVSGAALRLVSQPCDDAVCSNPSQATVRVAHRDGLIPLLTSDDNPLTCARDQGHSTLRPCRAWTSEPLALAMVVSDKGLRLLEHPATVSLPKCQRLRDVPGKVLTVVDGDECVYDASAVIGKAPSQVRAYEQYLGKLLVLRRPAWEFEPRSPFSRGRVGPWDELPPRQMLVHHQSPKSFPLPLIHPATHRELVGCKVEPWMKNTAPFVGRATTSGLEVVIAPAGYFDCEQGI